MRYDFDAAVIGTGQAGPSLASRLAAAGRRVVVVERARYGGTCVNYGCIPTKTMVAGARVAHVVRRAADYGVRVGGGFQVDLARMVERKEEVVALSRDGLEHRLKNTEGITVIEGHARFTGPREIAVGDRRFTAERVFVNVGTRAWIPPLPGIDRVRVLTNADMLELREIPGHLVIVGGSYIGLEFAQMFRRFGSEVTIVEKSPRLISREDADVSQAVRDILEAEDIAVHLGAECIGVEPDPRGVRVEVRCEPGGPGVAATHLLVAAGRRPNTDDLGVDAAGIAVDERGFIRVDDELRTTAEGVWALGDVNGRGAFTHTSYNDHQIVAANLLDGGSRRVTDRITAYALYIDPPLGRAGLTETQVRASGRPALKAVMPMSDVGRAVERGETRGFMKALVDAETKHILGFSILGVEGDEVVHAVLDVMYAGAPYTVIERAVHIHPTVSELLPTLFGGLEPLGA